PGLGSIAVNAILEKDFPIVQATVLILSLSFVLANLLVDIAYGYIDPRIRYEE
ncbi:MAG: ABC transporter permease subunit, partial [Armatimonadetes bacterium]|nr:ABC transporter permease subunit [Armatimonadota bacterium]